MELLRQSYEVWEFWSEVVGLTDPIEFVGSRGQSKFKIINCQNNISMLQSLSAPFFVLCKHLYNRMPDGVSEGLLGALGFPTVNPSTTHAYCYRSIETIKLGTAIQKG